jgi:thioredoxin-related protein
MARFLDKYIFSKQTMNTTLKRISQKLILGALLMGASWLFSGHTTKNEDNPKKETPRLEWLDFQTGYDLAVKENKMMFIDMYTDWCGWCKVLEERTFNHAEVSPVLKDNFVLVKFNPEITARYMVGNKVMDANDLKLFLTKSQPKGYPSTFVWKSPKSSQEIEMIVGYVEVKPFLNILKKYLPEETSN